MVKNKKEYVLRIVKILERNFEQTKYPINFSNNFELLVAVILSAQCRDEMVNSVTENLFKRYKKIEDYANANIFEFENYIRSAGFFRNKAKNIIRSAQLIMNSYNGVLPQTMEELIKLPGVARKTANIVLSVAFNKSEGIAVDTHVIRIANLLKLTKCKNPIKIEEDLIKVIPKKYWANFSFYIQSLGKRICKARNLNHSVCPLNAICPTGRHHV
ncbi:MAG: endonuclease III [Endomicrobium sp.]|jgi:endonuclease-3|nr:endonuclease III [Endomicrobium sp.]